MKPNKSRSFHVELYREGCISMSPFATLVNGGQVPMLPSGSSGPNGKQKGNAQEI